jgi:hypothetical protein
MTGSLLMEVTLAVILFLAPYFMVGLVAFLLISKRA